MRKFIFVWFIENYSYCWHNELDNLVSPTFFVSILQQTFWRITLKQKVHENPSFMVLNLIQCLDPNRRKSPLFNYELSLLNSNETVQHSRDFSAKNYEFGIDHRSYFFKRPVNSQEEKNGVLDEDVLKVCCTMWIGDGKVEKEDHIFARSRIGVEEISFITIIENFSTIDKVQKTSILVRAISEDKSPLFVNICVQKRQFPEEEIILGFDLNQKDVCLVTCKIFLLNLEGKEIECGKIDTRNDVSHERDLHVPINLMKKDLLEKKHEYLKNDNLTIRCLLTLSSGTDIGRIEKTYYNLHLTPDLAIFPHSSIIASRPPELKSALDDFRSLYKDKILNDIELKTVSKTFPAHKCVLSARSPVFKTMLTTNMKEKLMACIEIEDLDDDTIDQFLIFLYTDILENLQLENAIKLFYAADKYQVQKLKDMCSSFLIANLNASNITQILILSDRHQDSNLKTGVENFLCESNKNIFSTGEWEHFMETNPQIAMKVMHDFLKK